MKFVKKVTATLLTFAIIIILCGCLSFATETEADAGRLEVMAGYAREAMDDILAYLEGKDVKLDQSRLKTFTFKGTTYYGLAMELPLHSGDTPFAAEIGFDSGLTGGWSLFPPAVGFGQGSITIENASEAHLLLQVTVPEEPKGQDPELMTFAEKHAGSMARILSFEFQGTVQQTGGCFNGVDVDGSSLIFDCIKVSGNHCQRYSFDIQLTEGESSAAGEAPAFSDVPNDIWYAPAVTFLAKVHLVSGYGDGRFGPNDNLTIAQYAQILAGIQGLETGPGESGWWAEKAVAACVRNGWLTDRGAVDEANYGTTIRRQEAIAALQRATQRPALEGMQVTPEDIPDYEDICEKYRADIVAAYNSGITVGEDEKGTLHPLSTLTRAEACQLIYNLGWDEDSLLGLHLVPDQPLYVSNAK